MAAVDTSVVMVAGAAEEKAERVIKNLVEPINLMMEEAVAEGATAVAVLVTLGIPSRMM